MRCPLLFFGGAVFFAIGCGKDATQVASAPPSIVSQPVSQQVPLGQTATFQVVASGTPVLSYQWQRNGSNIPDATSPTYSIPSASQGDTAAVFDVVVANAFGQAVSQNATLSIGARYPAAGDLRFQQVDAVTTVNGYTGASSGNLVGRGGSFQTNAFGIPLSVGAGCAGMDPNVDPIVACLWITDTFYLPTASPSLSINYHSYDYIDLQSTLMSLSGSTNVITGMDFEAFLNTTAFSWLQQTTGPGFDGVLHTVSTINLPAAVQAEGALGRVVTAITFDNGQVSFMSYGWQGNGSMTYDTTTQVTSLATAASVVTTMADEGYILTAAGGKEESGVLLVGSKVHGDTLPRPIIVVPGGQSPTTLSEKGYATVAVFYSGVTGFVDWVGER